MGTDITVYAEVKRGHLWERVGSVFPTDEYDQKLGRYTSDQPFQYRSYALFGWLANVRNYSCSPVISKPRGIPIDVSTAILEEHECYMEAYSTSWLTLAELLSADYDIVFWDRRITRQVSPNSWDGAALANEGEGQHITLRDHLGPYYFTVLSQLSELGNPDDVRIVFWFN